MHLPALSMKGARGNDASLTVSLLNLCYKRFVIKGVKISWEKELKLRLR